MMLDILLGHLGVIAQIHAAVEGKHQEETAFFHKEAAKGITGKHVIATLLLVLVMTVKKTKISLFEIIIRI